MPARDMSEQREKPGGAELDDLPLWGKATALVVAWLVTIFLLAANWFSKDGGVEE